MIEHWFCVQKRGFLGYAKRQPIFNISAEFKEISWDRIWGEFLVVYQLVSDGSYLHQTMYNEDWQLPFNACCLFF